jgi:hypothetical protein
MRKLLSTIAMITCITAAHAQPPQEIVTTDTVDFQVGQTRTLQFNEAVTKVVLASEGIASVVPQTDHVFTVQALRPGTVLTVAYGADGQVVHRLNIAVAGHMVKVYGQRGPGGKVPADYVGVICNGTGCGRADPDVEPAPDVVTISKTQTDGQGNSSTVQKQYGR